jgi:hypothetical protein
MILKEFRTLLDDGRKLRSSLRKNVERRQIRTLGPHGGLLLRSTQHFCLSFVERLSRIVVRVEVGANETPDAASGKNKKCEGRKGKEEPLQNQLLHAQITNQLSQSSPESQQTPLPLRCADRLSRIR